MTSATPRTGRLVDLFPPGFDSKSSNSRGHYNFAPDQLYRTLTHNYTPEKHVETTIVKSVWYGKQKRGARHEFILIEVQDTKAELINYIVLDRNTNEAPAIKEQPANQGAIIYRSKSCRSAAVDAFRVSYNGVEEQLLRECLLLPRRYLEKIEFSPNEPLFLYELATLAYVISEKSPNYIVAAENCYWFAGLIWECIRFLRPSGRYDNRRNNQRGRFAILRYTPEIEERNDICSAYEKEIGEVVERLKESRMDWESRTSARSGVVPGGPPNIRPEDTNERPPATTRTTSVYAEGGDSLETRSHDTVSPTDPMASPSSFQSSYMKNGRSSWYSWR